MRPKESARFYIPPSEIQTGSVRIVARPVFDVLTAAVCVIGAGADRVCVYRDDATDVMDIDVVGSATLHLPHGAWPIGTTRWGAFTYDSSSVEAVSDDGPTGGSWTLTSVPSQIMLGSDEAAGTTGAGPVHLLRGTVWSSRISSAELSALSP
jgi:hypothetical protein